MANTWKRDRARFLRQSGPRPRTSEELGRLIKRCIHAHASMPHHQADLIVETIRDAFRYHGIAIVLNPDGPPPSYTPPAGVPIYKDGRLLRVVAGGRQRAGQGG